MKIGILALQGAFLEHQIAINRLNIESIQVRLPEHMEDIDALIIPGGESTTMLKLLESNKLKDEIVSRAKKGMPIFGTCAGAILISKNVQKPAQDSLGLVDITITRNDYGRQIDSFEANLEVNSIGKFKGIFIRAPIIEKHNGGKVLAEFNNRPVLLHQDNYLLATFHPELTEDTRIHEYFMNMIRGN